jgi:hypothetical protein
LRTVGKNVGLIFNFGGQEREFDRLYFDPAEQAPTSNAPIVGSGDWLHPDLAYQIVGGYMKCIAG